MQEKEIHLREEIESIKKKFLEYIKNTSDLEVEYEKQQKKLETENLKLQMKTNLYKNKISKLRRSIRVKSRVLEDQNDSFQENEKRINSILQEDEKICSKSLSIGEKRDFSFEKCSEFENELNRVKRKTEMKRNKEKRIQKLRRANSLCFVPIPKRSSSIEIRRRRRNSRQITKKIPAKKILERINNSVSSNWLPFGFTTPTKGENLSRTISITQELETEEKNCVSTFVPVQRREKKKRNWGILYSYDEENEVNQKNKEETDEKTNKNQEKAIFPKESQERKIESIGSNCVAQSIEMVEMTIESANVLIRRINNLETGL